MTAPLRTRGQLAAASPSTITTALPQDSDNFRGAMLMTICMAVFSCNDTIMKFVAQGLPMSQAIFMRGAFVVPLLLLIGMQQGGLRLRLPRCDVGPLVIRTLSDVISTVMFLTALRHMAIGNLSAIMQSLPLVVMLGAALFYGEKLGWRRISAVLAGFVGVLLIVRPGGGNFDIWALLALGAVLLIAVRDLITRKFSGQVGSSTIAVYTAFSVMLAGLVWGAFEDWQIPNTRQTLLLLLAASVMTVGYTTAISSMRVGEISFVAPFRYTSLIFAIFFGLVVFGEWPDLWTLIGAALIVAAGIYAIMREGRARRRQ